MKNCILYEYDTTTVESTVRLRVDQYDTDTMLRWVMGRHENKHWRYKLKIENIADIMGIAARRPINHTDVRSWVRGVR